MENKEDHRIHDDHGAWNSSNMARVFLVVFGVLELMSGVLGNTFVLTAVYVQSLSRRKSVHTIFLLNLVLADILVLTCVIALMLEALLVTWDSKISNVDCRVIGFLVVFFTGASVMALLVISAHRFMRVCHVTLHKKVLTVSTAIVCSAVCWFIAFVIALLPVTHLAGSYDVEEGTNVCSVTSQKASDDYLMGLGFCILVEVPLIVGNFNWAIYRHWRTSRPAVDKSVQMTGRSVSETPGYMVEPYENNRNSALSYDDKTEEEREADNSPDDCCHQVDVSCDQHRNVPSSVQSSGWLGANIMHVSPERMRGSSPKQVPVTQANLCRHGKREKLFLASLLVPFLLASFTFGGFTVIEVARVLADNFHKEGAIAVRLVLVLNSSLNWLPYGLMNRRLRRDLSNRLRCIGLDDERDPDS